MKKVIPTSVFLLCKLGAYLVGSYAMFLLGKADSYEDYDLIVPPEKWHIVSLQISPNARINHHGGFNYTDEKGNEIDIWPCSIDEYLKHCKPAIGKQAYAVDYISSRVFTSFIAGTKNEKAEEKRI
jgi:hypothetical protein